MLLVCRWDRGSLPRSLRLVMSFLWASSLSSLCASYVTCHVWRSPHHAHWAPTNRSVMARTRSVTTTLPRLASAEGRVKSQGQEATRQPCHVWHQLQAVWRAKDKKRHDNLVTSGISSRQGEEPRTRSVTLVECWYWWWCCSHCCGCQFTSICSASSSTSTRLVVRTRRPLCCSTVWRTSTRASIPSSTTTRPKSSVTRSWRWLAVAGLSRRQMLLRLRHQLRRLRAAATWWF